MRLEVINTGTELLLGNVINTHLAFLGEALFAIGLRVECQICVPDGREAIQSALTEAFARGPDVVVVTGGLGPTSDDLTRDVVAQLLDRALVTDAHVLDRIRDYFRRLGRPVINENIGRQAQVPSGAEVLPNAYGTAPGLYLSAAPWQGGRSPHLFLLPGPPRELRPMFTDQVLPILERLLPRGKERDDRRNYQLVGIGESEVEEKVGPLMAAFPEVEVGYCARPGEVDLRLIGPPAVLERAERMVRPVIEEFLVSDKGETLEEVIVRLLRSSGRTLAVAESCTGGLIAHRITSVPGASEVFVAGLVPYMDRGKSALLGISAETIAQGGGSVSAPIAAAMAAAARRVTGGDFALSTTGYAGPGGGSPGNPVGTVFVGLAAPKRAEPLVKKLFFRTDRETFKYRASQAAFGLLRLELLKAPPAPSSPRALSNK